MVSRSYMNTRSHFTPLLGPESCDVNRRTHPELCSGYLYPLDLVSGRPGTTNLGCLAAFSVRLGPAGGISKSARLPGPLSGPGPANFASVSDRSRYSRAESDDENARVCHRLGPSQANFSRIVACQGPSNPSDGFGTRAVESGTPENHDGTGPGPVCRGFRLHFHHFSVARSLGGAERALQTPRTASRRARLDSARPKT